jgi:hypothetical protein
MEAHRREEEGAVLLGLDLVEKRVGLPDSSEFFFENLVC